MHDLESTAPCIVLSGKQYSPGMDTHRIAQALGRLGGKARARRLAPAERRRIAAQGGLSRSIARNIARRVDENFRALAAADALRRAVQSHAP